MGILEIVKSNDGDSKLYLRVQRVGEGVSPISEGMKEYHSRATIQKAKAK